MTTNTLIKYIATGLAGLTLAGCTVKEAPPIEHRQPVETQTIEKPLPAPKLSKLHLEDVTFQGATNSSPESVMSRTVLPLADVLLARSTYTSSAINDRIASSSVGPDASTSTSRVAR